MEDSFSVDVVVNGESHSREVDARLLLVDFIRRDCGLTGTHTGCDDGVCGACTVLLDGEPVKSCLMLAVQADGASVTTVEGLGTRGNLSPVQEAFVTHSAAQCGYCTPGFVVSATALLARCEAPTADDIREGLLGNICRCSCYINILKAVQSVADEGAATGGAR